MISQRPLNEREWEVLRFLDAERFVRPMDVGGTDGSHHSFTLAALVKRGLVESNKFHAIHCASHETKLCTCKGHIRYRRTRAGTVEIHGGQLPIESP